MRNMPAIQAIPEMGTPMIKYPKTRQFRDAITQIQRSADYHKVPVPSSVHLRGTVKLHGTNATICFNAYGDWWCQSRERVITPGNDNKGFAAWAHEHKEYFDDLGYAVSLALDPEDSNEIFQLCGEWCGGSIQPGVGISGLPKMFVAFNSRWITYSETTAGEDDVEVTYNSRWLGVDKTTNIIQDHFKPKNMYSIDEFPTYALEVDFNKPTLVQNQLVQFTQDVERCCPVANQIKEELELDNNPETTNMTGEGIVWTVYDYVGDPLLKTTMASILFKVKGEKHTESKVKTIAPVDLELVQSINEFVDKTCTENRVLRAIEKLKESLIEPTVKQTGEVIKFVIQDILEEEQETMLASGIDAKQIGHAVSTFTRNFYFKWLDNESLRSTTN